MNEFQFSYVSFAVTFADLLCLVCCVGALCCLLWIVPHDETMPDMSRRTEHLARIAGYALGALALSSLAFLCWRATSLSGEPVLPTLQALPLILTQTHMGQVWMVRAGALVVAIALWARARRHVNRRPLWWMIFLAVSVIAFSRSASDHAADVGDFTAGEWIDWLHLMAISAWMGSILVALFAVFPELARREVPDTRFIAQFAGRFSRSSGIALGFVVLAGTYNASLRLPDTSALIHTHYGWVLTIKLFLVLIAIALGAVNRFLHVRQISVRYCSAGNQITARKLQPHRPRGRHRSGAGPARHVIPPAADAARHGNEHGTRRAALICAA
jgi:copper resistance protein D